MEQKKDWGCCHAHSDCVPHYRPREGLHLRSLSRLSREEIDQMMEQGGGKLVLCSRGCKCGEYAKWTAVSRDGVDLIADCGSGLDLDSGFNYVVLCENDDDWEFAFTS